MKFEVVGYSDKGPRVINEDAWSYQSLDDNSISLCVADGVGGRPCGQEASALCVEKFNLYIRDLEEDGLVELVHRIDEALRQYADDNSACAQMASTLSGCVVNGNKLRGVHVGDTRVLILRGNGIKQLTIDHTEVNRLVQEKKLHPDDARYYPRRNLLEMAIGSDNTLDPYVFSFNLVPGDRILLTTDGVHSIIKKRVFRDMSLRAYGINDFANLITEKLLESKLKDNVTFVAAQVN